MACGRQSGSQPSGVPAGRLGQQRLRCVCVSRPLSACCLGPQEPVRDTRVVIMREPRSGGQCTPHACPSWHNTLSHYLLSRPSPSCLCGRECLISKLLSEPGAPLQAFYFLHSMCLVSLGFLLSSLFSSTRTALVVSPAAAAAQRQVQQGSECPQACLARAPVPPLACAVAGGIGLVELWLKGGRHAELEREAEAQPICGIANGDVFGRSKRAPPCCLPADEVRCLACSPPCCMLSPPALQATCSSSISFPENIGGGWPLRWGPAVRGARAEHAMTHVWGTHAAWLSFGWSPCSHNSPHPLNNVSNTSSTRPPAAFATPTTIPSPLCRLPFVEVIPGFGLFRGVYEMTEYSYRAVLQVGCANEARQGCAATVQWSGWLQRGRGVRLQHSGGSSRP